MPSPAVVPTPTAADATGLPDSQWVTTARIKLRDKPRPWNSQWISDGVGGVFGFGAAPVTLDKGPVYDGTPIATYVKVRNTTDTIDYTVVATGTPTATQVLIDYETQTFTFGVAPVTAKTIAFGYYVVKWTDQAILDALYAGLRQIFPSVGKTYVDSSVGITINNWDYTLPLWAQSPDAQISKIEYQDPAIPTEPWRPLGNWTRVGSTLVHIPQAQRLSPIAKLRITGWGPFVSLSDLEPDLYNLPIWYAGSVLLPWQESYRIRQDTMVPLTQEGGQAPLLLTQTGNYYYKRFQDELKQKSRAFGPPGVYRPIVTSYDARRHC